MQTHDCRIKLDAAGEHLSISEGCELSCIPTVYIFPQCNIMRAARTPKNLSRSRQVHSGIFTEPVI